MGKPGRKPTSFEHPQCSWCDRTNVRLDKDHIFPRAIGGTKELSVPACRDCQTVLSRLETQAARQSNYSLFCVMHGPPGRDKRRPASGVIRARYLLVKNPLGGYGEAAMRAGVDTPEALPHIEIDVNNVGSARRRGPSIASVQRLVFALKKIVDRRPDVRGFIGEVAVRTDRLPDIEIDPDFWPRVVLDLSEHVYIRARNSGEALRFAAILIEGLRAGVFDRDYGAWTSTEIPGNSTHWLSLTYDKFVGQRLAGKIACGLMFLQFGPAICANASFQRVRTFVLEKPSPRAASPVTQLCEAGTQVLWNGDHVAFLCTHSGRTLGIVSVYGDCHVVHFGDASDLPSVHESQMAMCRWDGKHARMVRAASIPRVLAELRAKGLELPPTRISPT
jgi:hypothetical protein